MRWLRLQLWAYHKGFFPSRDERWLRDAEMRLMVARAPRMEAEPGKTMVTLTMKGRPVATVVLHQITLDHNTGVSVQFVDLIHVMDAMRFRS